MELPTAADWYRAERLDDRITVITEPHVHPIYSANMHLVLGRDLVCGGFHSLRIEQVAFEADEPLMRPVRRIARQVDHSIAALKEFACQVGADPLGGAGDDGRVLAHLVSPEPDPAGTSASTRSGLPVPPLIFSGGAISIAPLGGRRSRLERHCSPYFPGPCSG